MFDRLRDLAIPGTKVPVPDIAEGSGVVLAHGPYVVTQPRPGQFCAFRKLCPHAGRPVDEVATTGIHCPAHGSTFSLEHGQPLNGPATKPLKKANVRIDGDRIIITG